MTSTPTGSKQRIDWISLWSVLLGVYFVGMTIWSVRGWSLSWVTFTGFIPAAVLLLAAFGSGKARTVAAWVFLVFIVLSAFSDLLLIPMSFGSRIGHTMLVSGIRGLIVNVPAIFLADTLVLRAQGSRANWRIVGLAVLGVFAALCLGFLIAGGVRQAPSPRPAPESRPILKP